MKIKIINNENGKKLGEIEVAKNLKMSTIADKVCEYLEQEYKCSIRKRLIQGVLNFGDKTEDLHYILMGENLPCRIIRIERSE